MPDAQLAVLARDLPGYRREVAAAILASRVVAFPARTVRPYLLPAPAAIAASANPS